MPKEKYDPPDPRRCYTIMSAEDAANGKKSYWAELEISGQPCPLSLYLILLNSVEFIFSVTSDFFLFLSCFFSPQPVRNSFMAENVSYELFGNYRLMLYVGLRMCLTTQMFWFVFVLMQDG